MSHNTSIQVYLKEYSNGIEYEEIEKVLQHKRRKSSPICVEYYTDRGIPVEIATISINNIRKKARESSSGIRPSNNTFWLNKGLSIEDANVRVEKYKKSISTRKSFVDFVEIYGREEGSQRWLDYSARIKNRQQTYLGRLEKVEGYSTQDALLIRYINLSKDGNNTILCKYSFSDYKSYCRAVLIATRISIFLYKEKIDPTLNNLGRKYAKKGYALDHKYSKYGGFVNKVHPLRLASYSNLQILSKSENLSKGSYCSISKEDIMAFNTVLEDDGITKEIRGLINGIFIEES